ncbi:MAG TPA: cation diffusion facilitator family transporter [Aigarchaeota archaeon]|nr:cation diffusion facilitator family transporter [Aigarchaeota archaeon]
MNKEGWALLSLTLNISQSLLKFVAGWLTGSLSLMGEAMHSLSDAAASAIAYASVKLSEKKHRRFPYGLYKLENIGAIVIAFFLIITAYEIVQRALTGDVPIDREYLWLGIGVVVFSLVSSSVLSFFERRAGKRLKSPTLIADSYHTLTDALGSSLVLVSLLSLYMGYNYDRYFAFGVAGLIVHTAFRLLKEEVGAILDISADEETVKRIREIILSFPEVEAVRRLLVRSAGGKLFIDVIVLVRSGNFIKSHAIADRIEKKIFEELGNVETAFIHYEPSGEEKLRIGILLCGDEVCRSFGDAEKVLVFEEGGEPRVFVRAEKSEEQLAKLLVHMGVDIVICGHHPSSAQAKWLLHQNGVFIWETMKKNIYEALSEVSGMKLGR